MKNRNGIPAWLLAGLLAAAVIALVGCGGGGAPAGPVSFAVDETTRWGDLVGQFSGEERECIRAALGEEHYRTILEQSAAKSAMWVFPPGWPEPWAEAWEVFLWGCLAQETAVGLFWANLSASMDEVREFYSNLWWILINPTDFALSEACVRNVVKHLDFSRLLTSGVLRGEGESETWGDYIPASFFFTVSILLCNEPYQEWNATYSEGKPWGLGFIAAPGVIWRDVIGELGNGELDCLRTELGEMYESALDRPLLREMPEPWEAAAWGCLNQENAARLFAANAQWEPQGTWKSVLSLNSQGSWKSVLGQTEDSARCARRALSSVDYPSLIAANLPNLTADELISYHSLMTSLLYCEPHSLPGTFADYSNDAVGVQDIAVGATVSAALDHPTDWDYFTFEAEAGTDYRINLTQKAPYLFIKVKLQDSSREEMASAQGRWETESLVQIRWQAPRSGRFQIAVGSKTYEYNQYEHETGPYTLSLTAVPEP